MNKKILIGLLFFLITFQVHSQNKLVLSEVQYYKNNYQITTEDSTILTQLLTKKYEALIKFNNADSTSEQNQQLWNNQLKYNKLINEIVSKSDAYKYFREQLKVVNEIKPLQDSQYKKLNTRYTELFKLTNLFSNKDRFDGAFKWSITDTIYYSKLFANQISDIAIPITLSENNKLQQYKPTPDCLDAIRPLIRKKSYQIALLTFANYYNFKYRDSLIKVEVTKYDSLILVLLIKDGVFINSGIINASVKLRKIFKLRNGQVDSLVERGMYLNKLKDSAWKQNALVAFDGKDFENIWLSKILEEEQFAMLLGSKYMPVAKLEAENIWIDIEKRGLTKGLKKEEAIAELTIYYTRVKASSSMYAYDIDKQAAYARSVKADMPYVLKLIQHARKNNITNADGLKQQEIKW
jgi:hypothetical protein